MRALIPKGLLSSDLNKREIMRLAIVAPLFKPEDLYILEKQHKNAVKKPEYKKTIIIYYKH